MLASIFTACLCKYEQQRNKKRKNCHEAAFTPLPALITAPSLSPTLHYFLEDEARD